jgi:hypothetical protein
MDHGVARLVKLIDVGEDWSVVSPLLVENGINLGVSLVCLDGFGVEAFEVGGTQDQIRFTLGARVRCESEGVLSGLMSEGDSVVSIDLLVARLDLGQCLLALFASHLHPAHQLHLTRLLNQESRVY